MNSVQVHLALTHVPVVLALAGLVMLIIAMLIKNPVLIKASYVFILVAGISALPVFFTGEGAEEAVEHAPGVSENLIESHEELAKMAMIVIAIAGFAALVALTPFRFLADRIVKPAVLLLTAFSCGLMIQTAHLGGQIRHPEITQVVSGQDGNEKTNFIPGNKEEDD